MEHAPSGTHYGLIMAGDKQIRRTLDTDDLPLARRKLQDLRRDIELTDPELARRTLASQAERFLPTVTGTPSTLYNVRHAINRLLADWPNKSPRPLSKIRKGDCEQWVTSYVNLAPSTINTYISCAGLPELSNFGVSRAEPGDFHSINRKCGGLGTIIRVSILSCKNLQKNVTIYHYLIGNV